MKTGLNITVLAVFMGKYHCFTVFLEGRFGPDTALNTEFPGRSKTV